MGTTVTKVQLVTEPKGRHSGSPRAQVAGREGEKILSPQGSLFSLFWFPDIFRANRLEDRNLNAFNNLMALASTTLLIPCRMMKFAGFGQNSQGLGTNFKNTLQISLLLVSGAKFF
jgi:hypothetical protein